MKRFVFIPVLCLVGMVFLSWFQPVYAMEIQTRYTVITYSDKDDLRDFNDELYMGRLGANVRKSGDTLEEEVAAKIDYIVEKVMTVLDMYPKPLKFSIQIYPDESAVQQEYLRLYHVRTDYIAFYSPSKDKVHYSADNGRLRVVTHEIGHVVAEHYFTVSPPQRIHEVMAQFAEKHITD